jgi:dUTP pyrophosphatase
MVCADDELIPTYATEHSAGADLKANISEPLQLLPQERLLIPTGIFVEIPEGFEIQIRPRSGLALNYGITVLNTPGTIDADYRGEIKVILVNLSNKAFTITPKMRIAQLVVASYARAEFIQKKELTESARGSGGFGHSGLQ